MGLRSTIIKLSDISTRESLRLGKPYKLPSTKYRPEKISLYLSKCESGSRPKGGIQEILNEGAISLGGEQIGSDGQVNLDNTPYVTEEFFQNAKTGKVKNEDILICKDGALTGKTCLVDLSTINNFNVMVNEHVFIFRANEKIRQRFLFYFTLSDFFQDQVKDLAYKKKAQPGLNSDHLKLIKIPSIPLDEQDRILNEIVPMENRIEKLKKTRETPLSIINNEIVEHFEIDVLAIQEKVQQKIYSTKENLSLQNRNIRFSTRWFKVYPLQNILYANTVCIQRLGRFIISTNNGWSPNCRESDTKYCVLGLNSISKNGRIDFTDTKYSDEEKSNLSSFLIKEGDFFISRGNTTDLVGLASVVCDLPEENIYIYPDLFIKIEIDETKVLKKYLAFIFNSIIGRLYFKYVTKGKNISMVKISADDLMNFYIPVPDIRIQEIIVSKIEKKINQQDEIQKHINADVHKIAEYLSKNITI